MKMTNDCKNCVYIKRCDTGMGSYIMYCILASQSISFKSSIFNSDNQEGNCPCCKLKEATTIADDEKEKFMRYFVNDTMHKEK